MRLPFSLPHALSEPCRGRSSPPYGRPSGQNRIQGLVPRDCSLFPRLFAHECYNGPTAEDSPVIRAFIAPSPSSSGSPGGLHWPRTSKNSSPPVQPVPRINLSTGLLHPLPTPSRPWSHIAVDFVTGLLPSSGSPLKWSRTEAHSSRHVFGGSSAPP